MNTTEINFDDWTAAENGRYNLAAPFVQSGYLYATDGRQAVRRPSDEPDTPNDDDDKLPNVAHLFTGIMPSERKPVTVEAGGGIWCCRCKGTGRYSECLECDGSGRLEECCNCGHTPECEDCSGQGFVTGGLATAECSQCESGSLKIYTISDGVAELQISSRQHAGIIREWLADPQTVAGINAEARMLVMRNGEIECVFALMEKETK